MNTKYTLDEGDKKLKVTIEVRRNWLLLAVYSLALVIWFSMIVIVLSYLIRGRSDRLVLTVILLLWLLFWLWLGRFLFNSWQYHLANRELLFIDEQQLMLRRPVSILGLTSVYGRSHVSSFYINEKHNCPAFDYAYAHVYFGQSLDPESSARLVRELNKRYFPDVLYDENLEDEG